MIAMTEMDVKRAVTAIFDYLNLNLNRGAATAKSLLVPEFKHIDFAIQQ